jgi:hypothetical protein
MKKINCTIKKTRKLNSILIAVLPMIVGSSGVAHAVEVDINYTADNMVFLGSCTDASCLTTTALPIGSNFADWTKADTTTLDLGVGEHWFAWEVTNFNTGSASNPAGLLAEILWDSNSNLSSNAWEYSLDNGNTWDNAVQYGANSDSSTIWNQIAGQIAGISGDAQWIYSPNALSFPDQHVVIKTGINIASVPEPATLGLMGLGLLGFGFARKKRS